jgi:periplasmic divalent cation tolerance protein
VAELGRRLVDERLCACVNVVPGLTSVYRWEGAVEEAGEALALLKTTRRRLDALEARVRELHPYDEPEFLAFEVDRGASSYLAWVAESVRGRPA